MFTKKEQHIFYKALLLKDQNYEGIFFVGIKTTGIFCRPTCSARKPKFENCLFFKTAQDALFASFRPCLRCRPLEYPGASSLLKKLIKRVEGNPEKRWKDADFKALGVDVSTVRRQFKKHFRMTFVQYARARRMGVALKGLREGQPVIHTQLESGYESSSGFRDAFAKIMGMPPQKGKSLCVLKACQIETPLGAMIAIADDKGLYLLEFADRRGLEREIEMLRKRLGAAVVPGENEPLLSIKEELAAYFEGTLKIFKTPVHFLGSDFQKAVWQGLCKIPYGETRSYEEQAKQLKKPKAFRAVARANGMNILALIVPCHRVIRKGGDLGGYGGGLPRKKWLLDHEKKVL